MNAYGIGVVEFCRRLREKLGPQRLILADGMAVTNQRAFRILNGIESEGWPELRDWEARDWSGGLNRHLFWNQNAFTPVFNYMRFFGRDYVISHPRIKRQTRREGISMPDSMAVQSARPIAGPCPSRNSGQPSLSMPLRMRKARWLVTAMPSARISHLRAEFLAEPAAEFPPRRAVGIRAVEQAAVGQGSASQSASRRGVAARRVRRARQTAGRGRMGFAEGQEAERPGRQSARRYSVRPRASQRAAGGVVVEPEQM